jgi:hypothetical protein
LGNNDANGYYLTRCAEEKTLVGQQALSFFEDSALVAF